MVGAAETLKLGVVVERRPSSHPWADAAWRAVDVIVGATDGPDWRPLVEDTDASRYLARVLPLTLHRRETEGYKVNLSQPNPAIYVALRGDGTERPEPFLVTACPYEAECYELDGGEYADAVPMPPPVAALIRAFVETHHVEEPFVKRKRKRHVDRDASPALRARLRSDG